MKILAKILDFIWNDMILILFARDPCKKCIVRACCSERCEEKTYYLNFCDIEGKITFNRICVVSIIFSCTTFCLGVLMFCFDIFGKLFL